MQELLVFAGFYGVGFVAHQVHALYSRHQPQVIVPHRFAIVATALTHPTVWEAAREYAVHFLIYSGHGIVAAH